MNGIKVSIIVPVHNTSALVSACVDSILRQTLKEIEIILVENGSSDDSAEQCQRIVAADRRVKFIQIEKADLSSARNAGIEVAQGDYIGFVDSDDMVLPSMFAEMYAAAIDNGLTIVSCNFCKRYDSGKMKKCYSQDGTLRIVTAKEATSLLLRGNIPVTVWSLLYHRSLFGKMLFPTDMYFEDRASTFRFMSEASKVGIINKALYVYYQRPQSIARSRVDFRKLRDYVTTDILRLEFIRDADMFATPQEKADAARRTANHLVRKLFYMFLMRKTQDQKAEYKSLLGTIDLIPPMTKLTLKHRLMLRIIKKGKIH